MTITLNPHPSMNIIRHKHKFDIHPFITPVYDGFKLGAQELKGKTTFVTVRTYEEKTITDVVSFVEKQVGGYWLIPTLDVAGRKWQMNPQTDEDTKEYIWLLVKVGL